MAQDHDRTAPALLEGDGSEEWQAEIEEAKESRQQKKEWLAHHPRPVPPRGQMRRRQAPELSPSRARSTTHTTPTDTCAKN